MAAVGGNGRPGCIQACTISIPKSVCNDREPLDSLRQWSPGICVIWIEQCPNGAAGDAIHRSCGRLFWGVEGDGHADNQSTWKLTEPSAGQRTQDQTHLLQGQGLQEAHPAQSHTIQGWQGTANALRTSIIHLTRSRHPCSRKESVDMIANKPVTVVRQNPCSIRRPRQRKRSC
jgi:hypothetical protein